MSEVHEVQMLKCDRPGCHREFSCSDALRRHQAFHDVEEGGRVCSLCAKQFTTKSEILRHLRAHSISRRTTSTRAKNFQCELCKKKFFTRKDVKRHWVVHTGTRNFACSHCPQRFGRKDHLVRHVKKSHPAFAPKLMTSCRLGSESNSQYSAASASSPLPGCSRDLRSSSDRKPSAASEHAVYDTRPVSSADLFDLTDLTGLDDFKPPAVLPELRTILRPDGSSSSSSSGSGVLAACYRQDSSLTTTCEFGSGDLPASSSSSGSGITTTCYRQESNLTTACELDSESPPTCSVTPLFVQKAPTLSAEESGVDINHNQPTQSGPAVARRTVRVSRPDSCTQAPDSHESYHFR